MYGPARSAYAAYQKNEIENLTPVEIVSRLYQKLHIELQAAVESIQQRNGAGKGESLSRALAIIGELQASLNLEEGGEIAANLNDLYDFLTRELTMANLKSDAARLTKAIQVVAPLVEAWDETAQKAKGQARVVAVQGRPAQPFHATY